MSNNEESPGALGDGERPIRVLVVDDEPLIVQMLTIALTYEKFDVSVAPTSAKADEYHRATAVYVTGRTTLSGNFERGRPVEPHRT